MKQNSKDGGSILQLLHIRIAAIVLSCMRPKFNLKQPLSLSLQRYGCVHCRCRTNVINKSMGTLSSEAADDSWGLCPFSSFILLYLSITDLML